MIDSVTDAVKVEANRFALARAVTQRAMQLGEGAAPLCDLDDEYRADKPVSIALREIAKEHVKVVRQVP